jgi:SAM-dependent methyltransferase
MARWNPEGHTALATVLPDLGDELRASGFDGASAARLLGASGDADLLRNSTLYALWSHDRLAALAETAPGVLTQLFVRNGPVPADRYRTTVPARLRELLEAAELVRTDGTTVAAPVSISPYGRLHILSDPLFTCHDSPDGRPVTSTEPDPVMPPHVSTFLLLDHLRPRTGRLLDLGCGSGILGLALAPEYTAVAGVDVLPRAAAFSRANAWLNRRSADFRTGDFRTGLGTPRSVDHVVFNAPGRAPRKDGPEDPDLLSPERLLKEATENIVAVLADDGLAQILLVVAVPEEHESPADIVRTWLPTPDRISDVTVAEVTDPALSISPKAIERMRIQPGCLLADNREDAEFLMTELRRRRIREVKPVILSITT